jgi:hypothetical protein
MAAPPAAPNNAPLAARSPGLVPHPATSNVAANPAISIVVRMVNLLGRPLLRAITHTARSRFQPALTLPAKSQIPPRARSMEAKKQRSENIAGG